MGCFLRGEHVAVASVCHSVEEMVIKIHKSDEQLTLRLGLRKVADGLNFLGERGDTTTVNVVSKSGTPRMHLLGLIMIP